MIAGVGGLAIGMVVLVFRDILAQKLFPKLTREQSAKQLRLIIIAVWSLGALGIVAWATVEIVTHPSPSPNPDNNATVSANPVPQPEPTPPPDRTFVEQGVHKQFLAEFADAMQKNSHRQSDFPDLIRKVLCDVFDDTVYYNLRKVLSADLNDPRVKTFNAQCDGMSNTLFATMNNWGLDGSGTPISSEVFDREEALAHIDKASFDLLATAWSFFP